MPGIISGTITKVEYSIDYGDDPATATWVEIPITRIVDASNRPDMEAVTEGLMNGQQAQTAEQADPNYIVGVRDDDTFHTSWSDAARNGDPVWVREQDANQNTPRIIGGPQGCSATFTRAKRGFGQFGEVYKMGFPIAGGVDTSIKMDTA